MNDLSKQNLNILVTGIGGPAGISAVRLLQKQGDIRVYGTDLDELASGRFFVSEFRTMARCADQEAYARDLRQMIQDWSIDVVIPTVADELVMVREALIGVDVRLIVSPQSTLELCHEKNRLYEFVQEKLPEYMVAWQRADEVPSFEAEQYFFKPITGRGSRECRVISQAERSALVGTPEGKTGLVMEVLPGVEWTVDAYVAQDGSIPLLIPRERLQLSGGTAIKGRGVRHPAVEEASQKLLSVLPCYGPVCIQWKMDVSGQPKLIEINPRLSGGISISSLLGADPMSCLLQELREEAVRSVNWEEGTVLGYFDYKRL